MNTNYDDIGENEFRIIVPKKRKQKNKNPWKFLFFLLVAIIIIAGLIFYALSRISSAKKIETEEIIPSYFEPEEEHPLEADTVTAMPYLDEEIPDSAVAYVESYDTLVNDIHLYIYIPRNARVSLHLGPINFESPKIVCAAQAADIRQDNGEILGAFVLNGEPRSYGLSKKGYCAIIGDTVTIGMAENTPLFEEATQREGSFFRQYPLVADGKLVESTLRGKSVRRALCERNGRIFLTETSDKESMHDFAQALVDIGTRNAIYLVGSAAYGWAIDEHGDRIEWGQKSRRVPRNISYIVWRKAE